MGRTRRSRFRFDEVGSMSSAVPGRISHTSAVETEQDSEAIDSADLVGMHGVRTDVAPRAVSARRSGVCDANTGTNENLWAASDDIADVEAGDTGNSRIEEHHSQSSLEEFRDEPIRDSEFVSNRQPSLESFQGGNDELDGDEEELIDLTRDRELRSRDSETSCGAVSTYLQIRNWKVLWGILMTTGSTKLTRYQYQAMRMICEAFRREKGVMRVSWKSGSFPRQDFLVDKEKITSLPHFTTLSSSHKRILFSNLTVRSSDCLVHVDTSKAGARANSYGEDGRPLVPIRFVLPSEYARADLASPVVFSEMRRTSLSNEAEYEGSADQECTDRLPVVFAREEFYGPARCVSVDVDGNSSHSGAGGVAEIGDIVNVSLIECQSLDINVEESFGCGSPATDFKGLVSAIWTVQHSCRRNMDAFAVTFHEKASERHRSVARAFGYVHYRSPTDSVMVDIPNVPSEEDPEPGHCALDDDPSLRGPSRHRSKKKKRSPEIEEALKRRREALRELKKQTEEAWRDWEKPTLKPGDVVLLLSPCVSETASSAINQRGARDDDCLMIIHRFWVENEERSRHALFLAGGTPLDCQSFLREVSDSQVRAILSPIDSSDSSRSTDVRRVRVAQQHLDRRGVAKHRPVSSTGTLSNGEKYFIYRFLLFWDGFEITKGKSASGDGFYMICLNLPLQARSSANAVRVISLTPPGVKSPEVFNLIQGDIVKGLTDGFLDVDAEGTTRRIFLDLVGFLGDTPALNEVIDVLGHTSNACCHLCRFVRHSSTIVGSRYSDRDFLAGRTELGRSFFVHRAIRDCGAQKETCRLLGMKAPDAVQELPIHTLCVAINEARGRIRRTADGVPVLPGILDPYKSCFIAPDHLLTGHLRDCINLAFKLLPCKMVRKTCENLMIGYLHDCDLPTQSRLFDHDKKALYSMSMSELYGLGVVAEYAFIKGCEKAFSLPDPRMETSSQCRHAISLVGSCARLISHFWVPPQLVGSTLQHQVDLRRRAESHLSMVRRICMMRDEDVSAMDDRRKSETERKDLAKEHHFRLMCIKTIDKPNVHRLLELVCTTLPMVGHVSVVGELVLEKAHQSLKRAIRQSNNKLVHLQSMNEEIFNDWQGRLAMVSVGAINGKEQSVRACIRLLSGREVLYSLPGLLTDVHREEVRLALGPEFCIPSLLELTGRTVLSPRVGAWSRQNLDWSFEGKLRKVSEESVDDLGLLSACVFRALKRATGEARLTPLILGNCVRSSLPNGTTVSLLRGGDIVEIRCYDSNNMSSHVPFLLCRQNVGELQFAKHEGPTFWVVISFLRTKVFSGEEELWVVLRPCHVVQTAAFEHSYEMNYCKYEVGRPLAFVKVGDHIRRTGKLHDCDSNICSIVPHKNQINHGNASSVTPGCIFFLKTKFEGYPPRRG